MRTSFSIPDNHFRFLFFSGIFLVHVFFYQINFARWIPLNGEFVYPVLPQWFFNETLFHASRLVFLLCCLLSALNMGKKILSLITLVSGTVFLILRYSSGVTDHHHHLFFIILFLFFIKDFFDSALSQFDFLFLARLSFCLVFFTSGVTKMIQMGFGWFDAQFALDILLRNRFLFSSETSFDINLFFIQHFDLLKYLFFAVLPLELLTPLALLRKFRAIVVLIAIFQIFAGLVLFAKFFAFIPIYLFWLDIQEEPKNTHYTPKSAKSSEV